MLLDQAPQLGMHRPEDVGGVGACLQMRPLKSCRRRSRTARPGCARWPGRTRRAAKVQVRMLPGRGSCSGHNLRLASLRKKFAEMGCAVVIAFVALPFLSIEDEIGLGFSVIVGQNALFARFTLHVAQDELRRSEEHTS